MISNTSVTDTKTTFFSAYIQCSWPNKFKSLTVKLSEAVLLMNNALRMRLT